MASSDILRFIERAMGVSVHALSALAIGRVIDPNDLICGALALDHLAIVSENAGAAIELASELRAVAMRGGLCLTQEERNEAAKLRELLHAVGRQVAAQPSIAHCLHELPCSDHSPEDL